MVKLNKSQILQLLKAPKNKNNLIFACLQEQWLKLHCEPIQQKQRLPQSAWLEYSTWVKSFCTSDKTARIMSLLTTPFETVATTKSIFDQLGKFFDAQDRFLKCEFIDSELSDDFNQYLNKIHDAEFWPTKGMEALRIGINSFIVCDVPALQLTDRPEPYYYLLDVGNVIDVDINEKTGAVEYIIFKQDDQTIIAIDDEFYRVFKAIDKAGQQIEMPYVGTMNMGYISSVDNLDTANFIMTSEERHSTYTSAGVVADGLGYCPVIDFYGSVISGTKRLDKRGPVTDVITKLNFLLLFLTLAKYYQLYGPFPIICSFKIKDKNLDDKNRETTDTGTNTISINQWSAYDIVSVDAIDPHKQPRNLIGPGSKLGVPAPKSKDDPDLMANGPIKIIEMNVDNLDWVKDYVAYLADDIKKICTGRTPQVNNAAKNEDQIGEGLEEQKAILTNISTQFERAHKFCLQTLAILRYSRKYYVSTIVDYGEDYFLRTADELTDEFANSQKSGMNMGYTHTMRKNVIAIRFKNNPDELARQTILLDLEPYPDLTWQEMQTAQIDQSDWANFIVKLNFITFIKKFENEYTNIVTFMAKSSYKLKLAFIQTKLLEYGKSIQRPPESNAGGIGGSRKIKGGAKKSK